MKVEKSVQMSILDREYTVLLLDDDFPNTRWTKVVSEGVEYKTTYYSSGRFDTVAIVGLHDLTGKEIEFI